MTSFILTTLSIVVVVIVTTVTWWRHKTVKVNRQSGQRSRLSWLTCILMYFCMGSSSLGFSGTFGSSLPFSSADRILIRAAATSVFSFSSSGVLSRRRVGEDGWNIDSCQHTTVPVKRTQATPLVTRNSHGVITLAVSETGTGTGTGTDIMLKSFTPVVSETRTGHLKGIKISLKHITWNSFRTWKTGT